MGLNVRRSLAALAVLLLASCAGGLRPPQSGVGGPVATAAVERFLQLVGERDYVQMGWVFGTRDGPVIRQWPRPEVEKRMYALASVLEHDSFVIGRESPVPGRIGEAVRFEVQLLRGDQSLSVPFVAVRGPDSRWLVEQVEIQAVTNVR